MAGILPSLTKHALAGVLVVLSFVVFGPPGASAFLTDTASHPPPTTGGQAYFNTYGSFGPNQPGFPDKGQSFVDPVFGSTINRLTNEVGRQSFSDIYSKNGYYNASNTLMVHNTPAGRQFINPQTGAVVRPSVPGNDNSSFDPVDPDIWWWYAYGGTTLNKYSVSAGTSTVVKTFSQPIGNNGGSIDWIDRTGTYMVLHLGNTWRMYDVKNDILYANPIPDTYGNDPGYTGLTPDGGYIITTNNGNPNAHRSWKVDHATKSVSTTGVIFWTLCGDHGDFVSASNGKSYWVVFECDSVAAVYAVDVSIAQSNTNKPKQLADNRMLIKTSWSDSGHFSRVSRGPMQDWAFGSIESGDDAFGSSVTTGWRAFKQEIVMVNVLSGEVRRLAHHRSRSVFTNYYYQPRVSASWDGSFVAWASNMGLAGAGYADIYSIRVDTGGTTPPGGGGPTPPPVTVAFTNPASGATVSGTTTVTASASGGSGTGYTYSVQASGTTIYAGANPTFSWNTVTTPNGTVTLSVTATDSASATGSASRSVSVSNIVVPPLAVAFTSPADAATVSGTVPVTMSGTGGTGALTYALTLGSTTIYSGPATSYGWDTTTVPNGPVTLSLTVTDGTGATASVTRGVTVQNTITPPPPPVVTENVTWISPMRVAVSGNTITKNAGCNGCWDAGAASQQTLGAGDALQFTASDAHLSVGLGNLSKNTSANEIKFALRMAPGQVEVRESGVYRAGWSSTAGAVYKIAVEGGKVKYYENGTLKYTSTVTPTFPLLVDSSLATVGAAVQGAVIVRGAGSTTTPADSPTPTPGTGQDVVWVNAMRVTVSGNSITKTSGCNGCFDAGAVSQQGITSGDGSVSFNASANASLTVGLSNVSKNTSANEIKFGLRFSPGVVEVRELGALKASWPYVAGAIYSVALEGGHVKYYENGTLKYTSAHVPTYPLIVDSSLGTVGAGVQNAVITK